MGSVVLGWILVVVGIIAVLIGIGGGTATMFIEIKKKAKDEGFGFAGLPTDLFKALLEFINGLAKAPLWLALIAVGFVLIAWGGSML